VRTPRSLVALGLVVGLSACATLRVGSDYDREASFAGAATYDWAEAPVDEEGAETVDRINPFIDRRMRRAVEFELDTRGLLRVEEGPVDLLVSVSVLAAQEIEDYRWSGASTAVSLGFAFGTYPGWFGPWGWYPYYGTYWSRYPYWRWGGRYGYVPRVGIAIGRRPYFGYPYAYSRYGWRSYGGYPSRDLRLPPGSFIIDVFDGESGDLVWRGWAEGALMFAPEADEMPAFISSTVHRMMEDFPIAAR
jgi:hypothetical protein